MRFQYQQPSSAVSVYGGSDRLAGGANGLAGGSLPGLLLKGLKVLGPHALKLLMRAAEPVAEGLGNKLKNLLSGSGLSEDELDELAAAVEAGQMVGGALRLAGDSGSFPKKSACRCA